MPYKTNSMSKRSSTQWAQLAEARAKRNQEGGPGPSGSVLNTTLAIQMEQLRAAQSAFIYAHKTLQETRMELEQEKAHSASLYSALCIVRRKQQRTVAAKEVFLKRAMKNMTLVDQLQEDNKALDNKVSELLETSDFFKEQQLEAKKKIKALQLHCKRISQFIGKEVQNEKFGQQTVSLMEKGVYTEEARELCRIMVGAGCSQEKVGEVIEAVFAAVGIAFEGPKVSSRTVAQAVLEGGVMSDL